jgi:hypothetical protein
LHIRAVIYEALQCPAEYILRLCDKVIASSKPSCGVAAIREGSHVSAMIKNFLKSDRKG